MPALIPAVTSSSSTFAQPFGLPLTQFSPPIVQHPKLTSDTLTSLVPKFRYFHCVAFLSCKFLSERQAAIGCASCCVKEVKSPFSLSEATYLSPCVSVKRGLTFKNLPGQLLCGKDLLFSCRLTICIDNRAE